MKSCDQPDLENPRYRCSSTPEDGFDQCSRHRQEYIKDLEAKLAEAEKRVNELDGNYDFCLEQERKTLEKLSIAIDALKKIRSAAIDVFIENMAEEALEKIKR